MINERKPELPVVFLVTSDYNLYDEMMGIYCVGTNGKVLTSINPKANYNQDWTRWASFEFQDYSRDIFQRQSVGIAISGNASRGYDQKSFKIKGKTKYGQKRFDYDLFPNTKGVRYKSFLLRSGGQYYNSIALLHDAIIQSCADVTPLIYQASFPVVTFLNGKYWGIYNVRERKNKDQVYSYCGLSETDFDFVEFAWRAVAGNGSLSTFNEFDNLARTLDFTKDEDLNKIAEVMDIDNYLYYMAIEILINNSDWPNNNQTLFKAHEDGKWRWILQDLDKTIESATNKNLLKTFEESTSTLLSTKLITYLLKNDKFKDDYITVQSLVAGSVMSPSRFKARMVEAREKIAAEYDYHKEKWPVQNSKPLVKTTDNTVANEAILCGYAFENLANNFDLGILHSLTIQSDISDLTIGFNGRQIPVLPFEGSWFEKKTLHLTTPLYFNGKKFGYWSIIEDGIERKILDTTLDFNITKDSKITPIYETAGEVRRAGLYINEVSADNAIFVDNLFKYEDWIEILNNSNQPIDIADYYLSNKDSNLTLFQIPSGSKETVIAPNGHKIIWCSKKPERGVLHANFKLAKEGGSIFLSKKNENGDVETVDKITYVQHGEFASLGRYPDGSENIVIFEHPTFQAVNQYSRYNVASYVEDYPLVSEVKANMIDKTNAIVSIDETHSNLYIKWREGTNITIFSTNGMIVYQKSNQPSIFNVSVENLVNGVYIVVLESDNERKAVKFIK